MTFSVPVELREAVLKKIRDLGGVFVHEQDNIEEQFMSIEDVFPLREEEKPAAFLRGARYRERLTQKELADKTGIPARHISEMEHGKRPIGKKNARLLADALNVDARRFWGV